MARQRIKNSVLPSEATENVVSPPNQHPNERAFTCRRFFTLQFRWCLRTRPMVWIVVACAFSCLVLVNQMLDQTNTTVNSKKRSFPPRYMRFVYDESDASSSVSPLVRRLDLDMEIYPSKREIHYSDRARQAQEDMLNSKDYTRKLPDPLETEECKAQYKWQLTSFPTCNEIHATDLNNLHARRRKDEQVRLINYGYYRDVWMIREDFSQERRVLKTLRYSHDYVPRNYDRHRRDAVAMERLTKSRHILDIYGFCGNSGLFEYASGGDVAHLLWPSRGSERQNITQQLKLNVATQAATAIAEMHNIDQEGRASMAHTDISPGQFVEVNGLYRLNDFNRVRFLNWSRQKNKPCGYYVGSNPGKVSFLLFVMFCVFQDSHLRRY